MADDNEARINITANAKALKAGFDEATATFVAFKKSAIASFQTTAQQLATAFDAATAANDKFTDSILAQQQATMQFAGNLLAQQLKELTQAQTEAIAENKAYDQAQQQAAQTELARRQGIMQLTASLLDQKAAEEATASAAQLQKQQATMQFAANLETQKLKEFTQAQDEAIAANNAYDQALHIMTEGQVEAQSSMLTFASNVDKATQETDVAKKSVIDWAATYYLVKQAVNLVVGSLQNLFDAAKAGAEFERLQESGKALAATFGVDLTNAVQQLKAASLDTISSQDAMIDTNKALLTGAVTNVNDLSKLMTVAAVNGRALGLSASQNFAQVIQGIDALSTRLLAFSGIVVNDQVAYETFAKSIGTTAAQLDGQQKRQALVNAILAEYLPRAQEAGGVTEDNAVAFEKFSADATDAENALKALLANAVTPLVKTLDIVLFQIPNVNNLLKQHAEQVLRTSASYADYANEMDRVQKLAIGFSLKVPEEEIASFNEKLQQSNPKLEEFIAKLLELGLIAAHSVAGPLVDLVTNTTAVSQAQYDAINSGKGMADNITRMVGIEQGAQAAAQKLADAITAMSDSFASADQTSQKFTLADASKYAVAFNKNMGATDDQLMQLKLQLGVVDQGFVDFSKAMEDAGKNGMISAQTVQDAWSKFILPTQLSALSDKLAADLQKVQDTFNNATDKLGTDTARQRLAADVAYGRKKQDIATQDARKLQDLQIEIANKEEALADSHNKALENIQIQHQRQIDAINQRYDLARIKALIDLDGRALFEAQAQRSADLSAADKDAKQKAADENANYAQSLKDLADYQQQKKDQIALDDQRAREDAKKAYDQQEQDITTQNAQRLADIVKAYNDQSAQVNAQYVLDYDALTAQNKKVEKAYQDSYNVRVGDMLDFFKTNQNILQQLQSGNVSIDQVLQEWNQSQGIPFGGIPWNPGSVPHNCPTGCHWSNSAQTCVDQIGEPCGGTTAVASTGNGSVTQTAGNATTNQNLKVTLNVTGDGILANAVRQSALNAIWEVIS